jgi:N-acetylmuramate 1-kinase
MDMIAFSREAMGLPESHPCKLTPFSARGSDRTFFRFTWDTPDSAILVHYDPKREENAYYGDISIFLHDIGVPVPRLIRHDRTQCLMVMEDMGNQDLWSFRHARWGTRRAFYRRTLVAIHALHSFPEKDFPSPRVKLMPNFGPELYKWEQDYFREHFVDSICGIKLAPVQEHKIEAELSELARRLDQTPRSLVHRDFQSQNIMIRNDKPFLIDFQGMRFGSPFYDLGSLLYDPYVEFSDSEINDLLSFYYNLSGQALDWPAFLVCFWEAAAQRLMQALGAYGFLGIKKNLAPFLAHIPAGLSNLHRAASHAPALLHLLALTESCRAALDEKA